MVFYCWFHSNWSSILLVIASSICLSHCACVDSHAVPVTTPLPVGGPTSGMSLFSPCSRPVLIFVRTTSVEPSCRYNTQFSASTVATNSGLCRLTLMTMRSSFIIPALVLLYASLRFANKLRARLLPSCFGSVSEYSFVAARQDASGHTRIVIPS